MLFIILVMLCAFMVGAPCLGMLMLIEAVLNPPKDIQTMQPEAKNA